MVYQENAADSLTYMLRLTRRTALQTLAHDMHVPARVYMWRASDLSAFAMFNLRQSIRANDGSRW